MTEERRRGIIKTLAIAALYFIFILIADQCHGQAKQFQLDRVCYTDSVCVKSTGYIVFTTKFVFLNHNGTDIALKVVKVIKGGSPKYFVVEDGLYYGFFILDERSAYFEFNVEGYQKLTVRYFFKQYKT